jgi:hypothetical protein
MDCVECGWGCDGWIAWSAGGGVMDGLRGVWVCM